MALKAKGYPIVSADANPYTGVLIVINYQINPYIYGEVLA